MSKAFAKLAERFAEMTGDKDVTAISDTFEQNARGVDAVEACSKDLLAQFSTLLQPNPSHRAKFSQPSGVASRLTGGGKPEKYPQQELLLSQCLEKHGEEMEKYIDNCTLAQCLGDSSHTFKHMAEARDDLDYSVKQNVFEQWQSMHSTQMKEVKDQKTKMEGRRLYYDNLRKKYQRNPEKVNQMEVEQAKNKLEETLRQTDASMDAILCSDIDRVAQLKHLIDAQAEYHTKAGQLLNELSSTLNKRIQEAKPRSGTKPMASLKVASGGAWGGDSDMGFPTSFSSNFDNNKFDNNTITNKTELSVKSGGTGNDPFDPWGDTNNNISNQSSAFDNAFGNSASTNSAPYPNISNTNNASLYALPPPENNNDPFNLSNLNPAPLVPVPSIPARGASSNNNSQKPCCKGLYDFEPENPGELGFKANDIITLISKIDENWFEGSLHGKNGYFPCNFVQVVTPL
jgi:hypothetical protein